MLRCGAAVEVVLEYCAIGPHRAFEKTHIILTMHCIICLFPKSRDQYILQKSGGFSAYIHQSFIQGKKNALTMSYNCIKLTQK